MSGRPIFNALSVVIVCTLIVWMVTSGVREWRDWAESDSWQTVETQDFSINSKSSRVRYQYIVNGNTYQGTRTHFFVIAPFQDNRVLRWIDQNRAATTLAVHYAPDAPASSVLVREVDSRWALQWPLIGGVIISALLLPILFFGSLWRWLARQFKD